MLGARRPGNLGPCLVKVGPTCARRGCPRPCERAAVRALLEPVPPVQARNRGCSPTSPWTGTAATATQSSCPGSVGGRGRRAWRERRRPVRRARRAGLSSQRAGPGPPCGPCAGPAWPAGRWRAGAGSCSWGRRSPCSVWGAYRPSSSQPVCWRDLRPGEVRLVGVSRARPRGGRPAGSGASARPGGCRRRPRPRCGPAPPPGGRRTRARTAGGGGGVRACGRPCRRRARGAGALLGRATGARAQPGRGEPCTSGSPEAVESRPDHDPLDVDGHRHPVGVVLAQPAIPEGPGARRAHERGGGGPEHVARSTRGRSPGPAGRVPWTSTNCSPCGEAVLAGVVGERHVGVALDPLELLGQAEGGGEGDRPGIAVAQAHRGDTRHHRAAGGGHVGERGGHVAAQHLVDFVGPGHAHGAEPTAARWNSRQPLTNFLVNAWLRS